MTVNDVWIAHIRRLAKLHSGEDASEEVQVVLAGLLNWGECGGAMRGSKVEKRKTGLKKPEKRR